MNRNDNQKAPSLHNKRAVLSRLVMAGLGIVVLFSSSRWGNAAILGDILFFAGIILAGIATAGRMWCSVYISGYKITSLITTGPYSMCRNPLYFFSLLGAAGVGMATETVTIPLIIFIAFMLYYPLVIRKEEERLLSVHQDYFREYMRKTPRFVPSFSLFHEPESYVFKPAIFRKRVIDSLWFVWLIGVIEIIESLHIHGILPVFLKLY